MPRKAKELAAPDLLGNPAQQRQLRRALEKWFARHGRDLPWRRTQDPYAILVSEFMLQQTQVATVIPYYERWLARFPDFVTLAAAPEADVLHAWQGLGYYARARNLHRAAKHVAARHGGALPGDLKAILELPGVGRYTAGAIASFAFNLPAAAVEANIGRVLARLTNFQEPIDSPVGLAHLWAAAEALLPQKAGRIHNSALMELGALLCTPRNPGCMICPVRVHCTATEPELLPLKKARPKTVALAEDCGWIIQDGRLLLERQTGPRWRGLWKLPQLLERPKMKPLYQADYPFTNHRVTLRVFAQSFAPEPAANLRWFDAREIEIFAMAAPHRRAVVELQKSRAIR
jgi:A/G-specific adenine glycosylase